MKYVSNRLVVLRTIFFLCGTLFILRLFQLQVLGAIPYGPVRDRGDFVRGEIFVSDGDRPDLFPIGVNERVYHAYVDPSILEFPQKAAEGLEDILGIPQEELLSKLMKSEDRYEPIAHSLSESDAKAIRALGLRGIGVSPEVRRRYPAGELFAQITGFVGYDGDRKRGRYGIEEAYEGELSGETGITSEITKRGADIVLTIDYRVQLRLCQLLKEGMEKSESLAGSILVMEASSGDIVSLCTFPSYDPNEYNEVVDQSLFVNDAIVRAYEPGSVFKPITIASALDAGAITADSSFQDTGSVKFGSFIIRNSLQKVYGTVTMTDVLDKSINTGSVFAALQLGPTLFASYMDRFGFGKRTGIRFPGEGSGNTDNVETLKDIYTATASFGQGMTVTTLQLARAYAVFANGGFLVTPRLVREIVYPEGTAPNNDFARDVKDPAVAILASRSATTIAAMLGSVVHKGYGKAARVHGYFIAGKTGTAQIPDPDRKGYIEETIHTFGGFFPVERPRFVVIVKLDRPKRGVFADSTAAPLFGKAAAFLLQYYKIPPSVKE